MKEEDINFNFYKNVPFLRYAYYNRHTIFYAFQGLKHWLGNESEAYFTKGFWVVSGELEWESRAKNHVDWYGENGEIYFDWSKKRERQLNRLIHYAKQKGIEIIFYKTPLYEAARQFMPNRKEKLQQIEELSKKNQIPFWNFDDLDFVDDATYFNALTRPNHKGVPLLMEATVNEFLKLSN
jgi:hypothetical protein